MRLNLINKTFLPMFGDEGGDDNTITLTQAELESKIADAVAGLKEKKKKKIGGKKKLQRKIDLKIQKIKKKKKKQKKKKKK
ncbi:hypothetical protein JS84_25085 [Vibrio vulnificus]|uniref:hypothetical protein n=1 Tax=Vibrio vulnificus TaxID=672 RepID=UPI000506F73D|nr:hypothetical protein [Vibrio vulnificus]KFK59710.1 hypothetical protein JS84_25085 [Vibrio vulnificus]